MVTQKSVRIVVMALVALGFALGGAPAAADVKMPAIFGDNMVLQQEMKIPVWGWAEPGEKITVTLTRPEVSSDFPKVADIKSETTADKDGRWIVRLEPSASNPRSMGIGKFLSVKMTITGKNTITIKNILIGEVWLGSGQSNMELAVTRTRNAAEEIAKANYPEIRLFTVRKNVADAPQKDCQGSWVVCTPATVKEFSAAMYYFGRQIHQDLKVPVGLINSSWGGTPIEPWTPLEVLKSDQAYHMAFDLWAANQAGVEKAMPQYEKDHAAWQAAVADLKPGQKPSREPAKPSQAHKAPAALYNGMIAPLVPFAIRGALWYQGESNSFGGQGPYYRAVFPAMIEGWRKAWGEGQFPFLYVQITGWDSEKPRPVEPQESGWGEIREAQLQSLALPGTAMVVTTDLRDEPSNIHPTDKQEVGRRLAMAAEALAYGKKVIYKYPACDAMKIEGDKVRLTFKDTGGGLMVKDGAAIKGFAIAGADKKFVWAEAKIDGDTVIVSSDKVKIPTTVRYGWEDDPQINLFGKDGLPVSPFQMPSPLVKTGTSAKSATEK